MNEINNSFLEVKKSKFYGYLYKVDSTEDVEIILNKLKSDNKKARHIVYAYKINSLEKNYSDKEPSGTTRGLLDIIKFNDLNNVLIVVIRYFGGTLLGSGPLTRTYSKVSSMLINKKWFYSLSFSSW